jgi:hypothetical protein
VKTSFINIVCCSKLNTFAQYWILKASFFNIIKWKRILKAKEEITPQPCSQSEFRTLLPTDCYPSPIETVHAPPIERPKMHPALS